MEENERIEHVIRSVARDDLSVTPRTHLEKVIVETGEAMMNNVQPNVEEAGEEPLENLKIGGGVFYIPSVKANPSDEATETLEKLKIDETTYSLGGGGGALYKHLVQFSAGASRVGVTIITTDETAFDRTKLMQYLLDNGHISESESVTQQRAQSIACVGSYGSVPVLSLTRDNATYVTLFTTVDVELNKLVSTTNFIDVVSAF